VAAYARLSPKHPIHPAAFLKQTKRFLSSARTALGQTLQHAEAEAYGHAPRARYGSSRVAFAVSQSTGHAAFASTLRPNLTGGAFPRTAGGYSLGTGRLGGRRFFSHTPQPAAQVVHNVSQAMRAFVLQGKRAQYDGTDGKGRKRFRSVTPLQDHAVKKMRNVPKATPGAWVEFGVNPTITALTVGGSPLAGLARYDDESDSRSSKSVDGSDGFGLQTEGLLDILQTDFSRALRELAYVLADIKSFSALGDLPISYSANTGRLRIHFPGTDMETVEKLATEFGVRRGVIGQDEDFDAFVGTDIALMFPLGGTSDASSYAQADLESENEQLCGVTAYAANADAGSARESGSVISSFPAFRSDEPSELSDDSLDYVELQGLDDPWAPGTSRERLQQQGIGTRSPTGMTVSDLGYSTSSGRSPRGAESPLEYSTDFEGLYRFIEMCDRRTGF
jgi:hypothetical protein